MARWTSAQRTALQNALATGAYATRDADGNSVTFRSAAEIRSILDAMDRDIDYASRPNAHLLSFRRGDR